MPFLPRGMTSVPLRPEPMESREQVDARLMQRMAERDHLALGELYDRFSTPLFSTAMRIVRERGDAQDIVHDAFVTLWDKAATFDTVRGSAFSWAVTLVRNRSIDLVRMRRRRAELLAKSVPGDFGFNDEPPANSGEEAAATGDEARAIRAAVGSLPAEQKRALELAFFGGLTQAEVARTLAEPIGTVKARIRRGLLKLRESLARRL